MLPVSKVLTDNFKLHNVRSPREYEVRYEDKSDHHRIECVHPFADTTFAVGCSGDGLVKLFELRNRQKYFQSMNIDRNCSLSLSSFSARASSYSGPILALNTPSPLSSSLFMGIWNGTRLFSAGIGVGRVFLVLESLNH